jgi:hypothetical protein
MGRRDQSHRVTGSEERVEFEGTPGLPELAVALQHYSLRRGKYSDHGFSLLLNQGAMMNDVADGLYVVMQSFSPPVGINRASVRRNEADVSQKFPTDTAPEITSLTGNRPGEFLLDHDRRLLT